MNNLSLNFKPGQGFTIKRKLILCDYNGYGVKTIPIGTDLFYVTETNNPILNKTWIVIELDEVEYCVNPKALVGFDYSKDKVGNKNE